jgi:hypothetical protein
MVAPILRAARLAAFETLVPRLNPKASTSAMPFLPFCLGGLQDFTG